MTRSNFSFLEQHDPVFIQLDTGVAPRLQRPAKQLTHEAAIDIQFIYRAFATDGGTKGLDRRLGGN